VKIKQIQFIKNVNEFVLFLYIKYEKNHNQKGLKDENQALLRKYRALKRTELNLSS